MRVRACPEPGAYEIEAASSAPHPANLTTAILSIDDGSEKGQFLAMVQRTPEHRRAQWSEPVTLNDGQCILLSVQTGEVGRRSSAYLWRVE